MPGALTWQSDERCVVGATTFQTLPLGVLDRDDPSVPVEGADFVLLKERPLVERYVALVEELRPRQIVELGVFEGASTAFFLELARPHQMVAIDRRPPAGAALRNHISRRGLGEIVQMHCDVDQADRRRLAEIVGEDFGGEPLDLIVDDCSHMYEATRASFNELFPRLRSGGAYVIEDWPWAHGKPFADRWSDRIPLTRLVLELVFPIVSRPGLIEDLTIDADSVEVRRGGAEIDPRGFDVADYVDSVGRDLLADTPASRPSGH